MAKTEINKTENEYISKYLAPLIEKGVITDVKEGDHSKIFFDLSKQIKRMKVSCQLEPSYKGVFIVFQLLEKSKSGNGFTPLLYDVATLPIPNPNEDYYKLVEMVIKEVTLGFKKALTELQAEQQVEEEKTFPIMKIG